MKLRTTRTAAAVILQPEAGCGLQAEVVVKGRQVPPSAFVVPEALLARTCQ
jgi:hypothetical protein